MSSPPRIMSLRQGLEPKYIEASGSEPRVIYLLGGTVQYVTDLLAYEQTGAVAGTVTDGQMFTQDVYLVSNELALVDEHPAPAAAGAIMDALLAGGGIAIDYNAITGKATISTTGNPDPTVESLALPVREITGTSYTLQASDQYSVIHCNSSSLTTITVPPIGTAAGQVAWDAETLADGRFAGCWVRIVQRGSGQVQVVAGANVTLQGTGALPYSTRQRYSDMELRLFDDTLNGAWQVQGDLTPVPTGGGVVAPANTVAPAITPSGSQTVGTTINVSTGTWSNSPTAFAYQWKRGATNVGTNTAGYRLVTADVGQTITCVVTATNSAGSASATSSNSVTVPGSTTKATPIFDGSTRAAWDLRQASIPGASSNGTATLSTGGTANGTNIVEYNNDPLGVLPAGMKTLQYHQNEADGNTAAGYIRLQAVSPPVVQIDGSKTYWMRRCIAFPNNYPVVASGGFYSLGSYFGEPYQGTSAMPMSLVNKNGTEYLIFSPNAYDVVWQTPLVRGTYHKIVMRVKTVNYTKYPNAGPGWLEVYYAPWGQALKLQTLVGTGGTAATGSTTYPKRLVNNNTRLEFQSVKDGHNSGVNTFRIGAYRTFPQANFSGFNDTYHAQSAIFDDAAVSGPSAVDPE
jgi:hypothetical protein